MKLKILYALIISLVALIITGVLLNLRLAEENQPPSEETVSPEEIIIPPLVNLQQAPTAAAAVPPGITVIKPAIRKQGTLTLPEKEKVKKGKKKEGSAAKNQMPAPSSAEKDEDIAEEPSSGTIKLNKQPSEAESKEMNERGIMIW